MRVRRLFTALAVPLLLAAGAAAQNNTIKGKVRATDGSTVNNAIVELAYRSGGMIGQTVTRNDGDFAFGGLTPGEYELVVTIAGYEPAVQTVRFNQMDRMNLGQTLNVEVNIRAKPGPSLGPPGTSFVQDVPKPARAVYERAVAKLREGKSDEAIALFREAITLFADYFHANFHLGVELYRTNKLDEALQALDRARQINDRDGAVFYWFGLVMIKQHKFGVADYAFREAIRLNAADAASHFYRGLVLIEIATQQGKPDDRARELSEAEGEITRAWDLSEKKLTAVYRQRARISELRGDREAAARELENYLKAEPNAKDSAAVREMILKLRAKNN